MDKIYDVIILGAGPGGLAAGLYAERVLIRCSLKKEKTAARLPLQTRLRIIPDRW